ncbi:MAG TPA: glutamate--tRNA ligase [Vicinamibacterales bacterium]|nr:glutamate--tRNA ligase [Vicinamibacterales bacterium]
MIAPAVPAPRVRFAPSPTGYLHVGGARTALFNWLFARRLGGTFVLRIEDTDMERSTTEMVTGILDGLRWLGLDWDEGPEVGGPHAPYYQSERLDRYRTAARDLVARGRAYYDFGGPEKRGDAAAEDDGTYERRYDRDACLAVTAEEVAAKLGAGEPYAIRFLVPAGETTFTDLVHGPVRFDNAHIEDFVVLRSDGYPTYHLSVVVDDLDMAITHVVRGDDHISNTPKQVLLYHAFGKPVPHFAHVPLIMGPDKKRLSKRHGATSVMEYERQGYLPEAMVNFLALLGWSPGNDEEMFTKGALVERFSLEGISTGNAVFNTEKLDWFNHQYLNRLSDDALVAVLQPWFVRAALWHDDLAGARRAWFLQVLALLRPRSKRLGDFVEGARPFLRQPGGYDADGAAKHLSAPGLRAHLEALRDAYAILAVFDEATLEQTLRALAEARGLKAGTLIHATRLAMTGKTVSPGLFETVRLLGQAEVTRRFDGLISSL